MSDDQRCPDCDVTPGMEHRPGCAERDRRSMLSHPWVRDHVNEQIERAYIAGLQEGEVRGRETARRLAALRQR